MKEKMNYISLSKPNLNQDILDNMRECIDTAMITDGHFVSDFEQAVADFVGVETAVATSSGTSALHIGLRLLGVGQGDEVIAPNLTFIAAVNPIVYQGGFPYLIDCDKDFCLDPVKLRYFLENDCERRGDELVNISSGRPIRAIIVVHVFGNIADMEAIMTIADNYNLPVLEDATEALGSYVNYGKFKGRFAGTIGTLGAYSFNANKIITAGGGGMLVCGLDKKFATELLVRAKHLSTTAKRDALYFTHDELGYNYRMLNIQAAIGVSQIKHLDEFIEKKHRMHELYRKLISKLLEKYTTNPQIDKPAREAITIKLLPLQEKNRTNAWFYSLFVENLRDDLMLFLIKNDIDVRPVWQLITNQPPYIDAQHGDINQSEIYQRSVLNLPCHTAITEEEVGFVVDKIEEFFCDKAFSS